MTTLCIFNPEHDISLSNGNKHYVPPASATHFARSSSQLMEHIYPGARCVAVDELAGIDYGEIERIESWGWDARLLHQLVKHGAPENLLPSEACVEALRQLQHRSHVVPMQQAVDHLQGESRSSELVGNLSELDALLQEPVVLKAPWSGAGRGLCWVGPQLGQPEIHWAQKVIHDQRYLVVEPRRQVQLDFAIEYTFTAPHHLTFSGYSLFETQHGVYRSNLLLDDTEIQSRVISQLPAGRGESLLDEVSELVRSHLLRLLSSYSAIDGLTHVLGVDLYIDDQQHLHVSEINFRHTMGMVAHAYLQRHPEQNGHRWVPYELNNLVANQKDPLKTY